MALEDRAVRRSPEPLLDSGARVSDDRVLPRFDLHHVDEDRAVDGHAPFGTPAGDERGAGACDESLRWHATRIHASSSKALPLDYGHSHPRVGQTDSERRRGLSGADDDRVEPRWHGDPSSVGSSLLEPLFGACRSSSPRSYAQRFGGEALHSANSRRAPRNESLCIGPLVRDPEGATSPCRGAPEIIRAGENQMATSCEHLDSLTLADFPPPRTPGACEKCTALGTV